MSAREHSRSCKDNAQKMFAPPAKEKRNLKELKAAKDRQVAEEILASLEKRRRNSQPHTGNTFVTRRKDNRGKRIDPRKDFTPSKEGKLYYKLISHHKPNDKNSKSRKRQSNEPVLSSKSASKIQSDMRKFKFEGMFLQRNLAYLRAFENLNKNEELRHLLPESTSDVVKKTSDQDFGVELSHFKVTKKKFVGNSLGDYDTNIAVYMLSHVNEESFRTLLDEFCIPSNGVNLVAKNTASKVKIVWPQIGTKFSLSKVESERSNTQIMLEFRIFLKSTENSQSGFDSFFVDTKLVPLVRNGSVTVSSNDFMTIPLKRNGENGPEFVASLNYVISVKPKEQNRYLDFCRERRAIRNLGEAYKGSDYEGSLREKHEKLMNKKLSSDDFLSSDEEPNEDQFDEYVDQLTSKLSKLMPPENNKISLKNSQKKGINTVCCSIYDRKMIKYNKKTPDYLVPIASGICEKHDKKKLGKYGICASCKNYIDYSLSETNSAKPVDNIFDKIELNDSDDVIVIEPMEVDLDKDSQTQRTSMTKNESGLHGNVRTEKTETEKLEQKSKIKNSEVQKKPKKVDGVLTINKGFYFSNALPLELHFICGIRGSFKRTTKFPVCLLCETVFDCYELLLLHLIFSHRRVKITHFPSNFGSVLEIRKTKKKNIENDEDKENNDNEGDSKKGTRNKQHESSRKKAGSKNQASKKSKGNLAAKQENSAEIDTEKSAESKDVIENGDGQDAKQKNGDLRCFVFTSNRNFEISENLLYRKVYLSTDDYGKETEPTMARISAKAEIVLKRNAIGIMAINQV